MFIIFIIIFWLHNTLHKGALNATFNNKTGYTVALMLLT